MSGILHKHCSYKSTTNTISAFITNTGETDLSINFSDINSINDSDYIEKSL